MSTNRSASGAKRATKPRTAATGAKRIAKPRAAATGAKRAAGGAARAAVSAAERERMIREAAYLRAAQRGFTPGDEVADWLAAEAEVTSLLKK